MEWKFSLKRVTKNFNIQTWPKSPIFRLHICISFLQHRDTQETLAVLDRLDLDTEKPSDEEVARKFGFEEDYFKGTVSWWQHLKPQMWSLFDEPYSSNAAKVKISQISYRKLIANPTPEVEMTVPFRTVYKMRIRFANFFSDQRLRKLRSTRFTCDA